MADPDNTRVWGGATVYVGSLSAASPTDVSTAWGTGWEPAGFISPEGGVNQARDQETNSFYGWSDAGQVLLRRVKSQHTRTFTFNFLEDNGTVFQLINPGSPAPTTDTAGITTKDIHVPVAQKIKIGMELVLGSVTLRRFSHDGSTAELSAVGEVVESATALMVKPTTVVLYPNSAGLYYRELDNA